MFTVSPLSRGRGTPRRSEGRERVTECDPCGRVTECDAHVALLVVPLRQFSVEALRFRRLRPLAGGPLRQGGACGVTVTAGVPRHRRGYPSLSGERRQASVSPVVGFARRGRARGQEGIGRDREGIEKSQEGPGGD
eukprot:732909-Prorocentrum_minimum.AAC.1